MRRWSEAYPERFAHELAEFERRGLNFALDEERLAHDGTVLLSGVLTHAGREVELQVGYPDSFPFMRPEVFAPGLSLGRHQNPVEGNLCLLERSSRAWGVSDTAAWLVAERVGHLLDLLEAGGEELLAGESPQGEPASVYFIGEPGAVVFTPEEMLAIPPEHKVGLLQLATGENEPPQQLLRACLAKVSVRARGAKRHMLASVSEPLSRRFSGRTLDGRWVRLEKLPNGNRPRDLLAAIAAVEPGLAKPRWQRLASGGDISVVGAVFGEEVRQGDWQDSWLFVVTLRDSQKGAEKIYIARGERLTAADLNARLPAASTLAEKTIGVVGLGSLGSPIVTELLRAQVGELRVIDFDRVEAGNIVRWTHGLSAVGHLKSAVVAGSAGAEFPFTQVMAYNHRIGVVPAPGDPVAGASESEGLEQFLDGLDLLIDATGELGIQHLISTLAHELELPQIYAWGTEGGWGGAVACVSPADGGCWMCLQLALDDGTIELPPAAGEAPVQPRGCADPTFTAPGYSLTPIVAQAARAAARMCSGDGAGEVHVCALHDSSGELPAPRWVTSPIGVYERCPCEHHALAH
jgi:molybdopterin/thiamine biosynthesis adenylyltransferase